MLPIVVKLSAILKSECVNTLEFLLLLEKRVKGDNDSAIKEHHLFYYYSSSLRFFHTS